MEHRMKFDAHWLVRALVVVLAACWAALTRKTLRGGIALFWIWLAVSGVHGLRLLRHLF